MLEYVINAVYMKQCYPQEYPDKYMRMNTESKHKCVGR